MKTSIVLAVILATSVEAEPGHDAAIHLHWGRDQVLASAAQANLLSKALEIVETSNFNTLHHANILKTRVTEVHRRYREAVSGRYLLVAFEAAREIKTAGGAIQAVEIVIGLNRPDYADSVFTIDPESRIIEHAKFSGSKCIELMNRVREITKPN